MTDAKHAPLLPCPFCGSTDAYVQNAGWQANTFIRCPGCKTTVCVNEGPRPHEASVSAWNHRATQEETLLVQLQEVCSEFGVRGGENRIEGIRRVYASSQAEIARLREALNSVISAIGDWSRPTGANGMVAASETHPLVAAGRKARAALSVQP